MKRPAKIKILGKQIAILFVPVGDDRLKDHPKDKKPGLARSDSDKQEMYIQDGLPLETEQDAIWHEAKHIIEAYMGLDLPEEAIEPMATGELAVMKDNPALITYLRSKG